MIPVSVCNTQKSRRRRRKNPIRRYGTRNPNPPMKERVCQRGKFVEKLVAWKECQAGEESFFSGRIQGVDNSKQEARETYQFVCTRTRTRWIYPQFPRWSGGDGSVQIPIEFHGERLPSPCRNPLSKWAHFFLRACLHPLIGISFLSSVIPRSLSLSLPSVLVLANLWRIRLINRPINNGEKGETFLSSAIAANNRCNEFRLLSREIESVWMNTWIFDRTVNFSTERSVSGKYSFRPDVSIFSSFGNSSPNKFHETIIFVQIQITGRFIVRMFYENAKISSPLSACSELSDVFFSLIWKNLVQVIDKKLTTY